MKITYILTKDIIGRAATALVFELVKTKGVRITKGDRCFNGKSLLGILSNKLQENDKIEVVLDSSEDTGIVRNGFKEIAKEV